MKQKTSRSAFTFIEILVVTVLIGVLAAIVVVSFVNAGAFTRDARRKKDLANLQAALEAYKLQNTEYPESNVCGGDFTWPGCSSEWIPDLAPDFVSDLPVDPRQNTTGEIGDTSTETFTYNYTRPTATTYQILTRLENENDTAVNGDDYGYSGTGIYVVVQPR